MLDSHDKEEGLCHIRLALGAALGGAGTNMMGNGRMASPPLAEGGEHIAVPEKWTLLRGPPGCPKGWTARHALSRPQNCVTRDIWYGRLPLHTSTLLSLDGFVDVALEPWVLPGTSGSCSGCWRSWHRQWDAPEVGHYPTFYCAIGLRTPHTLHILRSWFLLLYWRCAGLSPLSPIALCSVAVSLSPRGATSSGVGYCPHPPAACSGLCCRI